MLEELYDIQRLIAAEMPEEDTILREVLDRIDIIIDELEDE